VFKHIASNWSYHILQIVVMMILAPMMKWQLGDDGNGIWSTMIAGTAILELMAMGIPMASVRHISEAVVAGDLERTNKMIATGFGITIIVGLIGLVVGVGILIPTFNISLVDSDEWAKTSPAILESARIGFAVTVVRVASAIAMRFPISVFHAKQDFITMNLIQNAATILRTAAIIWLLYTRPSVEGIAWIFAVDTVVVFLVSKHLITKRFDGIKFGLAHFDKRHVRKLLGFGAIAGILNVGTMIAYSMDALVISSMIGPDHVTPFDFGNKFFGPLAGLMYGIGAVVMPTATRLKHTQDTHLLKDAFLKWSKISLAIIMPVGLYLFVLGPRFIAAWTRDPSFEFSAGAVTRVLVPSFLIALPLRAVALPILLGTSHPIRAVLVFLFLAFVNLGLSVFLVSQGYGITGVAFGTAIPQVLFAIYLLAVTCTELQMSPFSWIKYVGGRSIIGALPVVAFLLWIESYAEFRGLAELTFAGVAMMILFAGIWVFYVYRKDPHLDIQAELASRLRR
jgi:O-antigen/teichoic acid export membrane protein